MLNFKALYFIAVFVNLIAYQFFEKCVQVLFKCMIQITNV